MFGLVLGALRARRAQTVALFVLTVLAALGASAAPWFLGWSKDAVAAADIEAAPPLQRLVIAKGAVRYEPGETSPMQLMRDAVSLHLDLPGVTTTVGARLYVTMTRVGVAKPTEAGLYLNSREGVCAELRLIEGTCPNAPGDIVLGRSTAESLDLHPGDEVRFEGFRLPQPPVLRISGTYAVANPLSAYWAGTDLVSGSAEISSALVDEPAYVSEQTLLAAAPSGLDLDLHMYLPVDLIQGRHQDLARTLDVATVRMRQRNLDLKSQVPALIAQIDREQRLVTLGVTVATTQLLLLCWFVLFLAVRHTSDGRRPDIGLLKIRGAARWRIWSLTALQSAIPMLVGAVVGWAAGFGASALLTADPAAMVSTSDTAVRDTLVLSVLASAAACLGALLAAVLAESRVLRSPVVALLRQVPGGHRNWRAEVGDLVILLLAGVGVYQGYAELRANGEASLLTLMAPVLVGLAVALLVARALPWLAAHAGAAALRSGRPGTGLTALHLARRRGTHRVFAVLAVCVAVFTTAMFFWHTASIGWADRAEQEMGAQRVLTVRALNSTALLQAVRNVDPEGAYAMAVARTEGVSTEDRLLAVDSSRLSTVVASSAGFGGSDVGELARLLRPDVKPLAMVGDGPLTVDLTGPAEAVPKGPVRLRLHLMSTAGVRSTVDFGPLGSARASYPAEVTGCPQRSCRLVALEPVLTFERATPAQSQLTIFGIQQPDHVVVDAQALSDITRWSGQLGKAGLGNVLSARDNQLTITPYTDDLPRAQRRDYRVFALSGPSPLPIVLAGARPDQARAGDGRFTVLGVSGYAYQVVAATTVLPRLGASGGVADLEYAQRSLAGAPESAALEVWLNAAAPADTVDRLEAAGVQVLRQDTIADVTDRLADQGPGVALRFQLFAASVVLLLAAGTVVVTAAVERRGRVEELVALRMQGLTDRSMVIAGHGGTGVLAGGAVLTGLMGALLAQALVTTSMPVFADGWSLVPLHRGAQPLPLLLAAVIALVVIGAATVTGSARVVASVRGRRRPDSTVGGTL